MDIYDAWSIKEKFENLLDSFEQQTVSAFLSYFFTLGESSIWHFESFEKYIYILGDSSEVYSKYERDFIERVTEVMICSELKMELKNNRQITCRIIATHFDNRFTSIKDEIAFMKICNKAYDGFNVYLFVEDDSIYFGCDTYIGREGIENIISVPIKQNISWDILVDGITISINEDTFINYYETVHEMISSLSTCYTQEEYDDCSNYTIEDETDLYDSQIEFNNIEEYLSFSNRQEDKPNSLLEAIKSFIEEVDEYQQELSFIKSSRVNAIELLFEAQSVESGNDDNTQKEEPLSSFSDYDSKYTDALHNSPEDLLKMLKKDRMPNEKI